ncbi:MAG: aromatic amino acid ammonia-lyase [Nitrososphaerales archaeon]|nr:aromatic amino acid ammonia-lyase [Nitrososphaerales archaeon]
MTVTLDGGSLTVDAVIRVAEKGEKVAVGRSSLKRMEKFRSLLEDRVSRGDVIYGVNTGFGYLSGSVVPRRSVKQLQLNLIRSHAIGVGDPMPVEVVRAAMTIRLNGLLRGNSAARPALATMIMEMLDRGVTPHVPWFGSLGASGDLVPSAHMALTMVGEGRAYHKGTLLGSRAALHRVGLRPVELAAKEGLSLINGTSFTTALACLAVHRCELLLEAANASVALTAEVLKGCTQAFDERLMQMRKVEGQRQVARRISGMLKGSRRVRSNPVPQDSYSIRCAPQVHGSTREALEFALRIVSGELNSVTDNPVFTEKGDTLHGGNFHAQPVAMALDLLSIATAYLGGISLARIHLLLSSSPSAHKFLAREPGLQSGLMVGEYTASALAAENAKEVYPLSTYPANVSVGIEDHASYGVNSGLKAVRVAENVARILAIELVCGSNYASSFEGELSPFDRKVCRFVQRVSPPLTGDRSLSEDVGKLAGALLRRPVSQLGAEA